MPIRELRSQDKPSQKLETGKIKSGRKENHDLLKTKITMGISNLKEQLVDC
jgi:hypothetical protein